MKSKHFRIEELVPKELFDLLHEDTLWAIFDDDLIIALDTIKEKFSNGTMTVNNWLWNGNRSQSGIRTKESKYYSPTSQHSKGCAIDCVFSEYNAEEVRKYIVENREEFPTITRLEDKVSWLHFDTKPTGQKEIYLFNV